MITYIRKSIKGYYVEYPNELDPVYWAGKIGTTYEDFRNDKWIQLSNEQVAFHVEHPHASISQVLSMTIPEPPVHVRTLEEAKQEKIQQIEQYNNSDSVNGFDVVINNETLSDWLTPTERSNYKNSIEAAEMIELSTVSLYVQNNLITLPIETAKMMLAQIQLYADACYLTTKQNIAEVNALNSIESVDNYDITSNYPTRLTFNV